MGIGQLLCLSEHFAPIGSLAARQFPAEGGRVQRVQGGGRVHAVGDQMVQAGTGGGAGIGQGDGEQESVAESGRRKSRWIGIGFPMKKVGYFN